MANPHDHNDQVVVLDVIEDPVLPFSESVLLKPRQLLAFRRSGVLSESLDPGNNPVPVRFRQPLDLLGSRRLDEQPKACHGAGGLLRTSRNQGSALWSERETR